MSFGSATILHVDMDAFFAACELRRRPELRGKPVVVGGEGQRGVVAAASYEARVFGIRSAMPSAQARRLCPDAVFLPGDHAHYAEVSAEVMSIFASFTPLVEPLSLDEAFLDVSGARRLHGSAMNIAHKIRYSVNKSVGLTCSVGVAPNKFLAKLATEDAKPKPSTDGPVFGVGVREIDPRRVQEFLDPLPIRAIWGVGPATEKRLNRLGATTVADIARLSLDAMVGALGNAQGRHLYELCRGIDDRPVVPRQEAKSVSHEETFAVDLFEPERLQAEIVRMADAVGRRLRLSNTRGRTVQLKVRFGDFTTITRSSTLAGPTSSGSAIANEARDLLAKINLTQGVRLLGVGVSGMAKETEGEQLSFDDIASVPEDWRDAEQAIDEIRAKFGDAAIGHASSLRRGKLSPKTAGEQQWGPGEPSQGER